MSKPWGINSIGSMIAGPGDQTEVAGAYFRAVPIPYRKSAFEAMRAAWWVLTGKAEAVVWPNVGDLEYALRGAIPDHLSPSQAMDELIEASAEELDIPSSQANREREEQ